MAPVRMGAAILSTGFIKNGARCVVEGIALDIFIWMEFQLFQPTGITE